MNLKLISAKSLLAFTFSLASLTFSSYLSRVAAQESSPPSNAPASTAPSTSTPSAAATPTTKPERIPGQLSEEELGKMLQAMGLKPTKQDKRYDFLFKAVIKDDEWKLSMSAVLSQDERSIWVMAWLDELPKSAADVPRTALLRLLADNDLLGSGKFFAYIAPNRRFVLQRVIPNYRITTNAFRYVLKDLSESVTQTHSHWSVAGWKPQENSASTAKTSPARTSVRTVSQPK